MSTEPTDNVTQLSFEPTKSRVVEIEKVRNETRAMNAISDALVPLEPESIKRVLEWANDLFQIKPLLKVDPVTVSAVASPQGYSSFADLYYTAGSPDGMQEKVLVAGYWFQVVQSEPDLDGFQLNKELKNLGYQSANITRDLDRLQQRKPQLVIQTKKEGNSPQSRKRYKLTQEGIRVVENMIANGNR